MRLEFHQHIFEKFSYTEFHENYFSGHKLFHVEGQTDRHDEVNNSFWQF